MKTALLLVASLLLCTAASAASPSSINNDDSCDVKVGPAATLLLPYFEVDTDGTSGRTTLFTITNVTRHPQIAHVTLWTDWSFPVLTFNVFLTGYDVQSINLVDVLVRGVIAPPSGTSSSTTPGSLSASTNPNIRSSTDCANTPGTVPASIIASVRGAFRMGVFQPPGAASCNAAGGVHGNAIGYATIDVVASCTDRMPSDPAYYNNDLLFDNVLIGDYQQIPRACRQVLSMPVATQWSTFARCPKVVARARTSAPRCRTPSTTGTRRRPDGHSTAASRCRQRSRRATSREGRAPLPRT